MSKPTLYVLIGVAGSGKSTWAQRYFSFGDITKIVSRDEIRLGLLEEGEDYFSKEKVAYRKFVDEIKTALLKKVPCVVADATHLNKQSRAKLYRSLGNIEYNLVCVYFDIPLEICKLHNSSRTGRRFVPEETIEEMYGYLEFPTLEENKRLNQILIVKE